MVIYLFLFFNICCRRCDIYYYNIDRHKNVLLYIS